MSIWLSVALTCAVTFGVGTAFADEGATRRGAAKGKAKEAAGEARAQRPDAAPRAKGAAGKPSVAAKARGAAAAAAAEGEAPQDQDKARGASGERMPDHAMGHGRGRAAAGAEPKMDAETLAQRRRARWQEVQARSKGKARMPEELPQAVSNELRLHAKRIAKLERIRSLGESSGKPEWSKRADALEGRERARHSESLGRLLKASPNAGAHEPESGQGE